MSNVASYPIGYEDSRAWLDFSVSDAQAERERSSRAAARRTPGALANRALNALGMVLAIPSTLWAVLIGIPTLLLAVFRGGADYANFSAGFMEVAANPWAFGIAGPAFAAGAVLMILAAAFDTRV